MAPTIHNRQPLVDDTKSYGSLVPLRRAKQVQGCFTMRPPQEAQKGGIEYVLTKSHTKLPVETLRPAEQPKRACFRMGRKRKKLGFGYVVLLLQTT